MGDMHCNINLQGAVLQQESHTWMGGREIDQVQSVRLPIIILPYCYTYYNGRLSSAIVCQIHYMANIPGGPTGTLQDAQRLPTILCRTGCVTRAYAELVLTWLQSSKKNKHPKKTPSSSLSEG